MGRYSRLVRRTDWHRHLAHETPVLPLRDRNGMQAQPQPLAYQIVGIWQGVLSVTQSSITAVLSALEWGSAPVRVVI